MLIVLLDLKKGGLFLADSYIAFLTILSLYIYIYIFFFDTLLYIGFDYILLWTVNSKMGVVLYYLHFKTNK